MTPSTELIIDPTDNESPQNKTATARRLLGEFLPFRRPLMVAGGLLLLNTCAQAAAPWLIGYAIDRYVLRGAHAGLARTMLLLLLCYIGGALAARAQFYRFGLIGQRALASLRARLFAKFQRLPLQYLGRHAVGDLMSRVVSDVETLSQLFSQGFVQIINSSVGLAGVIVALLLLNLSLALATFAVLPFMLLTAFVFARRARTAFRRTRETAGDITADLQEELAGMREARAFNRAETNLERFRQRNTSNRNANVQAGGVSSAFAPSIDVLSTLATTIVIGYGGYLVYRHELTVGYLTAFIIYVQQFFRPVQLLSQGYTQLQSSLAGAERIFAILSEPDEPTEAAGGLALAHVAGRIDFRGVSFAYTPGTPVLHDLSFGVEAGQTVAMVGRTGAGKTTIANLIPRFYDVTSGVVEIDGHDVRRVTRRSLRSHIAIVPQDPFLFSGTIADNIGYGREGAPREEIIQAASAVEAHTFIAALPQGYDTIIGERGGRLSTGQRQLISYARAMLANPRILILDEATSNVDSRTEALIQTALARLLAGRTSIVIAHRLSTVRHAEQILVIDDGQIVESGTHETLAGSGGKYAELYRRQFSAPLRTDLSPARAPSQP